MVAKIKATANTLIAKMRVNMGVSQTDVAAVLGIHTSVYSHMERQSPQRPKTPTPQWKIKEAIRNAAMTRYPNYSLFIKAFRKVKLNRATYTENFLIGATGYDYRELFSFYTGKKPLPDSLGSILSTLVSKKKTPVPSPKTLPRGGSNVIIDLLLQEQTLSKSLQQTRKEIQSITQANDITLREHDTTEDKIKSVLYSLFSKGDLPV